MNVKQLLREMDLPPSKRRGQNFLIDHCAAEEIVQFAQVGADQAVLEIGPGLGALTQLLRSRTQKLLVVEIEEKLCEHLRRTVFKGREEAVLCADIREVAAAEICRMLGTDKIAVVSNVPYSISSEVVLWALQERRCLTQASLQLQQEVAERIAADPGERAAGSLSVLRCVYAEAELGSKVGGDKFFPPAEVSSRLLRLTMRAEPAVHIEDEQFFSVLVRAAFAHRRKTLLNSLCHARLRESKEEIARLLDQAGIESRRRAESLSLDEFAALTAAFSGAE